MSEAVTLLRDIKRTLEALLQEARAPKNFSKPVKSIPSVEALEEYCEFRDYPRFLAAQFHSQKTADGWRMPDGSPIRNLLHIFDTFAAGYLRNEQPHQSREYAGSISLADAHTNAFESFRARLIQSDPNLTDEGCRQRWYKSREYRENWEGRLKQAYGPSGSRSSGAH